MGQSESAIQRRRGDGAGNGGWVGWQHVVAFFDASAVAFPGISIEF